MSIHRVEKVNNYSVVSNNTFMKDKNLSLGAIGLMLILLSCKDDTKFNMKFISIISNKSIKVLNKYMRELKNNYYIKIEKNNSKDGFYYNYSIYESKEDNPDYIPAYQNQVWESPPMENDITNKYYNNKINIDKCKLSFLTNYLLEWNFIDINNSQLIEYDKYLNKLLVDNQDNIRRIIEIVSYVVKRIKSNDYKDENNNPIINLLYYFKYSCNSNLDKLNNSYDDDLY